MPVIINEPNPEKAKPPFWLGVEITCPICECKFKLVLGDIVLGQEAPNGFKVCMTNCPACYAQMQHICDHGQQIAAPPSGIIIPGREQGDRFDMSELRKEFGT